MKRRTGWILGLLAALLLLGGSAAAEEAPDLTDRCTLRVSDTTRAVCRVRCTLPCSMWCFVGGNGDIFIGIII